LALAVVLALPAAAGTPVRTQPNHLPPLDGDGAGSDRLTVQRWPKPAQVVIRDKDEWRKAGTVNKDLSLACRAGRFTERLPMMYRAVFPDDVLGVAFGHGLNLKDLDHKAKGNLIYLFRFGATNACVVLTKPNPDRSAATPAATPGG
jgi:hypothetical protein